MLNIDKIDEVGQSMRETMHVKHNIDRHYLRVNDLYNKSFDYISTLPSFHIGYNYATELLIKLAEKHGFSERRDLLELCCGMGMSLVYLAKKYNFLIKGVDLNERQVNKCNERIINEGLTSRCSCFCANVLSLTADTGTFDVIWSEDSFTHINAKKTLFNICSNLLNKDGMIVFTDLVKTRLLEDMEEKNFCNAWDLAKLETAKSYKIILQNSGFVICELRTNLGKELIEKHIETNLNIGNNIHKYFTTEIELHRHKIIRDFEMQEFLLKQERANVYKYLAEKKLDYVFAVAIKKTV